MMAALHVIISQLKRYLDVDRIRLLDVPCGDLQWMSRFLQTRADVEYTGMDIVADVIDHHRKAFSDRPWKFLNVDIVSEPINVDDYDLVMTRMMMQHLTHGDVIRILHKFSNVTRPLRRPVFLLATTFSNSAVNQMLNVNHAVRFRRLNLEVEPFRLTTPLCLFRDGPWSIPVHFMGLWRLPLKVISESSCRKPVAVSTPLSKSLAVYSCMNWSLSGVNKSLNWCASASRFCVCSFLMHEHSLHYMHSNKGKTLGFVITSSNINRVLKSFHRRTLKNNRWLNTSRNLKRVDTLWNRSVSIWIVFDVVLGATKTPTSFTEWCTIWISSKSLGLGVWYYHSHRSIAVAVLGRGRGAQAPKSCPSPPNFNWFQVCIGGIYAGIRRIPTSGVFWQRINYLICHNKTGDIRLSSEQENVPCTVPHQTAEFLSLCVLFNAQRVLVGGTISI